MILFPRTVPGIHLKKWDDSIPLIQERPESSFLRVQSDIDPSADVVDIENSAAEADVRKEN
jgi:hypothetical protein